MIGRLCFIFIALVYPFIVFWAAGLPWERGETLARFVSLSIGSGVFAVVTSGYWSFLYRTPAPLPVGTNPPPPDLLHRPAPPSSPPWGK